jgi:hypothetical protein
VTGGVSCGRRGKVEVSGFDRCGGGLFCWSVLVAVVVSGGSCGGW